MINTFSAVPQVAQEVTASIGAISANTTLDVDLIVAGATPEMTFIVRPTTAMTAGVTVAQAFGKSGGGKVTTRFGNLTGSPITPGSTTFKVLGL